MELLPIRPRTTDFLAHASWTGAFRPKESGAVRFIEVTEDVKQMCRAFIPDLVVPAFSRHSRCLISPVSVLAPYAADDTQIKSVLLRLAYRNIEKPQGQTSLSRRVVLRCIEIMMQPIQGRNKLYNRECAAELRVVLTVIRIGFVQIRATSKDGVNTLGSGPLDGFDKPTTCQCQCGPVMFLLQK